MLLTIYSGQNYSYCYEPNTGNYFLYSNDYTSSLYLQGDDARIFEKEMEHIDNLPPPKCNDGRLTENIISLYL